MSRNKLNNTKALIPAGVMALLVTSCAYYNVAPYSVTAYGLDFKRYSDKGFFITKSSTVPFDYEPIGTYEVAVQIGEDHSQHETNRTQKYVDFMGVERKNSEVSYPIKSFTVYEAMDSLQALIESDGGNGVMMFEAKMEPTKIDGRNMYLEKCIISGMGFRRK